MEQSEVQTEKAEEKKEIKLEDMGELSDVVEAVIFAASEPVDITYLKNIFDKVEVNVTKKALKEALSELLARWQDPMRSFGYGFELVQQAGGYLFRSNNQFAPILRGLVTEKPQKLSAAHLEVLSIVAYRQPVTRIEIEEIRGVECSNALKKLLNWQMLKILGKSEAIGCPLLYGTTKHFLEFFGLNSLHDMPSLSDYESLEKGNEEKNDEMPKDFKDLFADSKGDLVSEETENLSKAAVLDLENALGLVKNVNKGFSLEAFDDKDQPE